MYRFTTSSLTFAMVLLTNTREESIMKRFVAVVFGPDGEQPGRLPRWIAFYHRGQVCQSSLGIDYVGGVGTHVLVRVTVAQLASAVHGSPSPKTTVPKMYGRCTAVWLFSAGMPVAQLPRAP